MDLNNLLDAMRETGVCLAVQGDQLRYQAPAGFVDLDVLRVMKEHKRVLMLRACMARYNALCNDIRHETPERAVDLASEAVGILERIKGLVDEIPWPNLKDPASYWDLGRLRVLQGFWYFGPKGFDLDGERYRSGAEPWDWERYPEGLIQPEWIGCPDRRESGGRGQA